MAKRQPTTRAGRRTKRRVMLPTKFEPQFLDGVDGRLRPARELLRRYAALREDTGVDTTQREILCQRAVFVWTQLETLEVQAVETGEFDAGAYVAMLNCLKGLLNALGLDRRADADPQATLKTYVAEATA